MAVPTRRPGTPRPGPNSPQPHACCCSGASPVGLELAGEITEQWPDTEVVLVDPADDVLGGRYLPELRRSLREQLTARGVRLELGSALTAPPSVPPGMHRPFSVTTAAGVRIDADLWFRCYGVVPLSDMLHGELAAARRPDGHVEVDEHLRVVSASNVFAVGDVTAVPEPKRSKAASEHAAVVAANIRSLAATARGADIPAGRGRGTGAAGLDRRRLAGTWPRRPDGAGCGGDGPLQGRRSAARAVRRAVRHLGLIDRGRLMPRRIRS